MFANLDRLRAERDKAKQRLEEQQQKYDAAEEKLKSAEKTQILDMVEIISMTPEELATLLHKEKGMKMDRYIKAAPIKKSPVSGGVVGNISTDKSNDYKGEDDDI